MESRSPVPARKKRRAPEARPTGFAGLAAWFGRLPASLGRRAAETGTARREEWLARRAAMAGSATGMRVPSAPPAPAFETLPDLSALVEAAALPRPELVPDWVNGGAIGTAEPGEGSEFFRLFRQNVDGFAELARVAGADDALVGAPPAPRGLLGR